MDRRRFLRNAVLLAAGTVAADQLDLLERLNWKRTLFLGAQLIGVDPARPGADFTAMVVRTTLNVKDDTMKMTLQGQDGRNGSVWVDLETKVLPIDVGQRVIIAFKPILTPQGPMEFTASYNGPINPRVL